MRLDPREVARAVSGEVFGSQVLCAGPGHSKNDQSLSIRIDPNAPDGFVVHSFAGDDPIACKDYVRERLGLPDWKPTEKREQKPIAAKPTPVCEYVYRLADGTPYLRVTRMSDKSFRQSQWSGNSWKPGKPAGDKIPYRLPELLASHDDEPVFVVEGEKDADRLASLGLIAVSSSEGAGKWTLSCAEHLQGRDVFILPDNDEPGEKHAAQVLATVPSGRIVRLPGLGPKQDVSDWLDAGGTPDRLLEICLNTAEIEPEPTTSSPLAPTPYIWTDPHEIPRREWLYGRHLIRRYVSTTISPGGLGKSSLLMAEAIAMATGRDFLGERPAKRLKVWYWNGEDDQDENRRRVVAICKYHQVTPEELGGNLFMDSGREKEILIATADGSGLTLNTELLTELENQIIANQIDVLVLDPFVASHNVGENDNMAINAVVRALARLAEHARCAVELVHHVRKPGGGNTAETDVNDARGASALIGGVRSARVLNVMSSEEAERLNIENRFSYFRVDNGKANLAPRSELAQWRHIVSVDLDNGNGLSSDHVGVVTEWQMPTLFSGVSQDIVADVHAVMRRDGRRFRADHQSSDWLGYAIAELVDIDPTERTGRNKIARMIEAWISSGVLCREIRPDHHRKPRAYLVIGETE